MISEDRSHKNHSLNPRKHPMGSITYPNASSLNLWKGLTRKALLSASEMQLLQDIPRILESGNYANLGHENGGSAILLARGLKDWKHSGKVYSIDLKFGKGCDDLMNQFDVFDTIAKCKGDTNTWAEKLGSKQFNFVFIDADHCYSAVVEDFQNWSPMVREGGFVAFHDTNQDFSHQAIKTVFTGNKEWEEVKELHIHRIRTFKRIR